MLVTLLRLKPYWCWTLFFIMTKSKHDNSDNCRNNSKVTTNLRNEVFSHATTTRYMIAYVIMIAYVLWSRMFYDRVCVIIAYVLWSRMCYDRVCFMIACVLWLRMFLWSRMLYDSVYVLWSRMFYDRVFYDRVSFMITYVSS